MTKKRKEYKHLSYIEIAGVITEGVGFTGMEAFKALLGNGEHVARVTVSKKLNELYNFGALSRTNTKPIVYTATREQLSKMTELQHKLESAESSTSISEMTRQLRPGVKLVKRGELMIGTPGTTILRSFL